MNSIRHRVSQWPPVTTVIILVCALMAFVGRVQPQMTVELMFYPPLAFAQPYRFLTSAVLHSGFWHVAFNMYALWLLGRVLEPALGKIRFLTLYLLSAIGGNVAIMVVANITGAWNIGAVGASGAIFGLFGALIILSKRVKANMSGILVLLGINLALGFILPGISWESHVGGLLVGILLAWMWTESADKFRARRGLRQVSDVASVLIIAAALVIIMLYI